MQIPGDYSPRQMTTLEPKVWYSRLCQEAQKWQLQAFSGSHTADHQISVHIQKGSLYSILFIPVLTSYCIFIFLHSILSCSIEALCSVMSAHLFTDALLSLKNYWLTHLLFLHLAKKKKGVTDRCKEKFDWAKTQSLFLFALIFQTSEAPISTWTWRGKDAVFNATLASSSYL